MDANVEASDAVPDAAADGYYEVPGGKLVGFLLGAAWIAVIAIYLDHNVVLSSDSMNNYSHVWWIARDLWHHGQLPWRMPVLGHGDAFAYPYGFVNWTFAAVLWPAFGNWGVTLTTVLGAVGCLAATFIAFPELREGWWTAAVLANPAIIEALLFGQQAFAWGSALVLLGVAAWRRDRRFLAALLVGLGQATHAPTVLPIGLLLVLVALRFVPNPRALLRYYSISLLISMPAVVLVFVSPGYTDSSTRDRLVNFIGTLGPRVLAVALPFIFVRLRATGIAVLAPLTLVVMLGANVALEAPLNVTTQWHALTRTANTTSLDNYLRSAEFLPGMTYRVLRGAGDAKLGLYHVLLAGGRLDSEMFPESMAIRDFDSVREYEEFLCTRHVDYVIAYSSYTASRGTNELATLARLATESEPKPKPKPAAGTSSTTTTSAPERDPTERGSHLVSIEPIARGTGHIVYQVTRLGCPS